MPATIEFLDTAKGVLQDAVRRYTRRLPGLRYCDLRLGVEEERLSVAEDGKEKFGSEDYSFSLGARVVAGERVTAQGFYGQLLGSADTQYLERAVRAALRHAYQRAVANAARREDALSRYGALGAPLAGAPLAPIPVRQDAIPPLFRIDPRSTPLASIVHLVTEASRAVAAVSPQVVYNIVTGSTAVVRDLFASSEGALLDQSYARTEGFVFVVSRGEHGNLDLYDFTGHQRGWEVLEEGYHNQHIRLPPLMEFALALARECVEVSNAPPLKPPEGDVVVVTDPHFNALLCHEVVGHPSELDRALKMETAYAGRSWFLRSPQENQLGRQVASPLVSVLSDPTMEGFGHYLYDDEGTPARRVYNIKEGIYTEFLSSRETAPVLGAGSNGHYKATEPYMVPLIRMSNTAFAPGPHDPGAVLKEVEHGYFIVGHRIPSVAESRENFRISARKAYEVRNGQPGQLYRDVAVMADSRDFFMNIDAVGTDFRLFPIPNCGKGQPMQAKRMSNGGPTLRSRARLTGV